MIAPARRNILIVDDDQPIAKEMTSALERMGYDVMAILATGEEALERSAKLPHPDIVIMDVSLAGALDGIQAGKYIEDHLNIPVVYITGYREKAMMLEEKGRVPLLKPFTKDDLRAAIGVIFYRLSLRDMPDPANDRQTPIPQKPDLNLNG